ncbi:Hint domain-containing protein [Wenxinia saemankumensis]|uniref:Hemolysin-type calcium-binding repeat-containing protein n=1 Tax=Wenxinia saemankumensis TaxID=1447782 RepID=A0A1M6AL16_9RHOB|nr:Hint domain-containing protein [Wenxinia saemankumensis]SHI36903.1 Hemolysin-type calcium-binding repeat-containing protein [Wenxinia saemankumensis]
MAEYFGGSSNDTLVGTTGRDTISGNAGNDTLDGSGDDDTIYGGDGNDVLLGGPGADSLDGGGGDDVLQGGSGTDRLTAGPGADTLNGGTDNDTLWGGADDDRLYGGGADDTVFGGTGADTLSGGDGADRLHAGDDDDTLYGGAGNDALFGEGGRDTLQGGTGADVIDGGLGSDTLSYASSEAGVNVRLSDGGPTTGGGGDAEGDTISGIDSLQGSQSGDMLTGYDGTHDGGTISNSLGGMGGDDTIDGAAGNDLLSGGAGSDTIQGGADHDTIYGGGGSDRLEGGSGADTIEGGGGADTILGGDGDDVIHGDAAAGATAGPSHMSWLDFGPAGTDLAAGGTIEADGLYMHAVFTDMGGNTGVSISDNTQYVGAGEPFATTSSLLLQGGAGPDMRADLYFEATETSGLRDAVSGLTFRLNDVDVDAWQDIVTVEAWDEFGNPLTVTLSPGDPVNDTVAGQTVTAGGGANTAAELGGSVLVSVSGAVHHLRISYSNGGGGEQALLISDLHYSSMVPTASDDSIDGGAGNDLIYGGAGTDGIFGGDGNDTIHGGDGDDRIESGAGADIVYGGAGNDVIDDAAGTGSSGNDLVHAGSGDDRVRTGDGGDTLHGEAGADQLSGEGGDDTLYGGDGADELFGGEGDDTLFGGAGADRMLGDAGADLLTGGDGDDVLFGGAGNDTLSGGPGSDTLYGGDDADTFAIDMGGGYDVVVGGEGGIDDDHLDLTAIDLSTYGPGIGVTLVATGNEAGTGGVMGYDGGRYSEIERFTLTGGNDSADFSVTTIGTSVDAGAGNDTLIGGGGDDTLTGGAGDDRIVLRDGFGDDSLDGGAGTDTLDGGSVTGTLTVVYSAAGAGTLAGGGDLLTFASMERLVTGSGGDTVTGSSGGDRIETGAGADVVFGGGGNDSVDGGSGDDLLDGGDGNDTLTGGAGADTLIGGAGTDTLYGGADSDTFALTDGFGTDIIQGGELGVDVDTIDASALTSGTTVVFTGDEAGILTGLGGGATSFSQIEALILTAQHDTLDASAATASVTADAGAGDDALAGGAGADTLSGGDGDDTLSGGAGDDSMAGGAGNDRMQGGAGADRLEGGLGDDTLEGGLGADTLSGGAGNDDITVASGDTVYGGDGDDHIRLADLGEAPGGTIHVFGGEGGETGGDTLDLGTLADLRTLVYTNADPDVGGGLAGHVFLDDGTRLDFDGIETVICFTPGTRLATARGLRDVADLAPGDMVVTRDHGLQPVRWIGRRRVSGAGRFAPIEFAPRSLTGLERRIRVSPQHRMLINGPRAELLFGEREVLAAATHLVDGRGIRQVAGGEVDYVHILFDAHEIVYAEGAATESFHPGDVGLASLAPAAREELFALFPELRALPAAYGDTARRTLKRHEARLVTA